MTINKTKQGTELTVALDGRLDTSTSPELEAALKDDLNGIATLIFDLEKLEYISSAGLRVLLAAQKTMNKQGTMKIVHAGEIVKEVFDVTGFTDILTIE